MKPYTRSNDVHDRIDGTNFMEMNFFEWRSVNMRLDLTKFLKNARSAFSNRRSQSRILQNFKNRAERTMLLLVFGLDAHASGGPAGFSDPLCSARPTRKNSMGGPPIGKTHDW